jgi:hypothetical protein
VAIRDRYDRVPRSFAVGMCPAEGHLVQTSNALAAISIFIFASLISSRAHADDSDAAPSSSNDWYGWEYAGADASGAALIIYARTNSSGPLYESALYRGGRQDPIGSEFTTTSGAVGTTLYLSGGPMLHLANGQPLNAAASLGARVVIPMLMVQLFEPVGGTVGFFVRDSHGQAAHCSGESLCIDFEEGSHADQGSHVGADLALFGGAFAAMTIDQIALSHETGSKPAKVAHRSAVELAPDVRVSRDLAFAGVGGRF